MCGHKSKHHQKQLKKSICMQHRCYYDISWKATLIFAQNKFPNIDSVSLSHDLRLLNTKGVNSGNIDRTESSGKCYEQKHNCGMWIRELYVALLLRWLVNSLDIICSISTKKRKNTQGENNRPIEGKVVIINIYYYNYI